MMVQRKLRQEIYGDFIEFVRRDVQKERSVVNRRMFSVFLWCFLFPILLSILVLILVQLRVLPLRFKAYLELLVLLFPVSYSIYFLSADVLREVPKAFRKGAMANVLGQAYREGEWREKTCEVLKGIGDVSPEEWSWVVMNFRMDLDRMRHRNRYMTVLAGAVFFLIMQGLDFLDQSYLYDAGFGDPWQFLGLGLFLVLLYLSGAQTHHNLERYLNCAELMVPRKP